MSKRRKPNSKIEELEDAPKSLISHVIKNITIGASLDSFAMPMFIFEPRSFLESLTDFTTHCQLLTGIDRISDPVQRLLAITRWYMSGYHLKPQGVKKPYNPLLGEIFRSHYIHDNPEDGATLFVAEQVSHHPPISAFHIENTAHRMSISGWLQSRGSFHGNSISAELDGDVLVRYAGLGDEEYSITFPTIYARGIIIGTLIMELGGKVKIICRKTNLQANVFFKTKPMFGGEYNAIKGYIKQVGQRDSKAFLKIRGFWDDYLEIENPHTKETDSFFDPDITPAVQMHVPPMDQQLPYESRKVWAPVTAALQSKNLETATTEKRNLEQIQRDETKARKARNETWQTRKFRKDGNRWVITDEARAELLATQVSRT
eukprot:gnl/Hemi2/3776_TR1323_c0_g4_i1.p1 gnl/Hemi2/3776_TR1323_c0_g4~~gnl/Hemi2/3776_TR1323_c0_g4_i1.p1  ORF type:complete len:374 (-),score=120.66 gnl/Hemi2/3776_TR1323_c0_g4_i1:147-1268(-)